MPLNVLVHERAEGQDADGVEELLGDDTEAGPGEEVGEELDAGKAEEKTGEEAAHGEDAVVGAGTGVESTDGETKDETRSGEGASDDGGGNHGDDQPGVRGLDKVGKALDDGAVGLGLADWWGSQLIMKGEYTQTQFLIILVAMLISAQLWGTMFALAPEFSRARTAISRIMNVINLGKNDDLSKTGSQPKQLIGDPNTQPDPEATGESKAKLPRPNAGGVKVTFKNVSFSYPSRPDVNILDNVSLTLQPGTFCGLVGPSGAGKSTIMNLVQRLYFPTAGSVLIDGHDIANLPTSFRDTVAIVPQDPTLFDGSVRFNVNLGSAPDTDATQEEIEEACKLANIHDVIMALPDGYDTECGPSASRLSGGQRQRLAIARALVRKPRLLLLDESTSALDAASEAALQEGLERASRGTTVLAITHRLHTVQKADVIFLVEGGQIVDSGKHQELMDRRESYRINAMQQMLQ